MIPLSSRQTEPHLQIFLPSGSNRLTSPPLPRALRIHSIQNFRLNRSTPSSAAQLPCLYSSCSRCSGKLVTESKACALNCCSRFNLYTIYTEAIESVGLDIASGLAGQHDQPDVDGKERWKGSRRVGGASDGNEKDGSRRGASFHTGQTWTTWS